MQNPDLYQGYNYFSFCLLIINLIWGKNYVGRIGKGTDLVNAREY